MRIFFLNEKKEELRFEKKKTRFCFWQEILLKGKRAKLLLLGNNYLSKKQKTKINDIKVVC